MLLSTSTYDPNVSPFINKTTNHICRLVFRFSWSFQQKQSVALQTVDLESTIASIIFDYATYSLWVIPKGMGVCKRSTLRFQHKKNDRIQYQYYTSFIDGFKIDPCVPGIYSCTIKKGPNESVASEIYCGVIDAKHATRLNKDVFETCIGYLALNDDYAYCFNRGGYYHDENRDPVGGAYNSNYSTVTCAKNSDMMNVYVEVMQNNKGLLDWGINNCVIGTSVGRRSVEIEVPKCGLLFACSAVNQAEISLQNTEIKTPNNTFLFEA
eukprot:900591_1